jgi:hypothetical protein
MRTTTISEHHDFLTVEEAARVLRIGRTAAYALARRWRDTNGQEGLPVVLFGRVLRVPRATLERIAGGSITTPPPPAEEPSASASDAPESEAQPPHATTTRRHRRAYPTSTDQPTLPLT